VIEAMAKRFSTLISLLLLLHAVAVACAAAETSPQFSLLATPASATSTVRPRPLLLSLDSETPPDTARRDAQTPAGGEASLLAQQKDAVTAPESETPENRWRWRRAVPAEYAAIAVTALGTSYVENQHGDPKARWTAHNDFDEGIRDALRLGSRSARDAANDAGSALMGLMIAAPIFDALATLGLRDSRWDALWQTEIMNAEAFTFAGAVSSLLQNLIVPRERPFVRNCQGGNCEDSPLNRSMPSGHAAFAFTGAGLVCTHHRYQSLYNDPAADRAACVTGMGLAIADGILRIVADRHYATDVIAGAALGMFSGFLLPRWLYYDRPQQVASGGSDSEATSSVRQMTVTPLIYSDGAGLNYSVTF
jgi:membrane-associated phospholipid phosphatase